MTKEIIQDFFKELKFFTNNDFAFVDVHNETLFYQNFDVLLKIVKMLQDIRLTGGESNQFLGDMFEGFLDQGVKQSEGQFFTPMPIVKFIINALPLESIKKQEHPQEKQKKEEKELLAYIRIIEQDKLYYFSLAYINKKEVIIVKAPSDGAKNKKFLGYEWSGRKGDEGIKYITSGKSVKIELEDAEALERILNLNQHSKTSL